ncbi:unnamed protein product [Ectocarpus sp. 13 AM-2016]
MHAPLFFVVSIVHAAGELLGGLVGVPLDALKFILGVSFFCFQEERASKAWVPDVTYTHSQLSRMDSLPFYPPPDPGGKREAYACLSVETTFLTKPGGSDAKCTSL